MRYPKIDRIHGVQRVMIPSPGQVILGPGRTLSAHPLHGSGESHPMVAGWVKMALPLRMSDLLHIFMADVHVEIKIQDLFGTRVNSCKI